MTDCPYLLRRHLSLLYTTMSFHGFLSRSVLTATVPSRIQFVSIRSSARFSTFKDVVRTRHIIHSPLSPSKFSRAIITDAQAVTPASSQEAWKKFAITAVRNGRMHHCLLIQVCRLLWQAQSSLRRVS